MLWPNGGPKKWERVKKATRRENCGKATVHRLSGETRGGKRGNARGGGLDLIGTKMERTYSASQTKIWQKGNWKLV